MKTIFVLFIITISLLFGCVSSPGQTQMPAETSWTLCKKFKDLPDDCSHIDLRDYTRIDADRSFVQSAKEHVKSKYADRIDYRWERLALIGLEDHVTKDMPNFEIVNRNNKNRTWELKPR